MENNSLQHVERLEKQIRRWIWFFILSTFFFGVTAFPLETELAFLDRIVNGEGVYGDWLHTVYTGVRESNERFPFLAYGTDWLAFAHVIIALLFFGTLKDPVRNKWVIDWGILCCLLALPLAFIAGPIRHIPFFHQLVDVGISLVGLVPLVFVRNRIRLLEKIKS